MLETYASDLNFDFVVIAGHLLPLTKIPAMAVR